MTSKVSAGKMMSFFESDQMEGAAFVSGQIAQYGIFGYNVEEMKPVEVVQPSLGFYGDAACAFPCWEYGGKEGAKNAAELWIKKRREQLEKSKRFEDVGFKIEAGRRYSLLCRRKSIDNKQEYLISIEYENLGRLRLVVGGEEIKFSSPVTSVEIILSELKKLDEEEIRSRSLQEKLSRWLKNVFSRHEIERFNS